MYTCKAGIKLHCYTDKAQHNQRGCYVFNLIKKIQELPLLCFFPSKSCILVRSTEYQTQKTMYLISKVSLRWVAQQTRPISTFDFPNLLQFFSHRLNLSPGGRKENKKELLTQKFMTLERKFLEGNQYPETDRRRGRLSWLPWLDTNYYITLHCYG